MIQTRMLRRGFLALGGVAAGSLAAPALLRAQTVPATATLADTMAGDNRFSRFLDLITRAHLVEDFRSAQPMTVFAPTDAAFNSAPAGILADLAGTSGGSGENRSDPDISRLSALINYHILPGAFRASDLMGENRRLRTRNGSDLAISGTGGALTLQNPSPGGQTGGFRAGGINIATQPARVVQANIQASNGVIHAVDQVLFP
ncbi:fasciclin domain-containing protein [Falsiroseomonas selenitidurans]|uniref:Fasciclin domain-containing protein n=1 Tax=Falsiroseomonas selenitidurans TaxID=2716335 RepID=A0ABX1E8L5_9PROT|nr:fasciclin domain-containing protein [Falsiroseomonas selenitidurans]NKC33559.1 fasciclin domain-containing protein [Falsiroseomonas selenitidurans]